jgi:pyrophosphatase PpaX
VRGFDPVLFDLDGTVVDTVELIVLSFRHAVRTVLGEDLPDEYITAGVGQPLMTQMERLSPEHAQELYDVYREYNHRRHDELIRAFDGVAEALVALKGAGRRLGIVTSKSRDTTAMAFEAVGMRDAFDVVVTATDTRDHKPSAAPILLCLERLAVARAVDGSEAGRRAGDDRAETAPIYIGDSPVDIEAGKAAGVATAAVAWGVFGRDALLGAGPDFWLQRPSELVDLCLRGEGRGAGDAVAAPPVG